MNSLVYCVRTGEMHLGGKVIGAGYSGAGQHKNEPGSEYMPDLGPIPEGDWVISGPPETTATHGPFVLPLAPGKETETYGRSGFLIHGERLYGEPGNASQGCIVLPRDVREVIWSSGEKNLLVVAENYDVPTFDPTRGGTT